MKGFAYAAETVEILKELARHFTVEIEFANAETCETGAPVFRIVISELTLEIDDTFDEAVRKINDAVKEEFQSDEYMEKQNQVEQEVNVCAAFMGMDAQNVSYHETEYNGVFAFEVTAGGRPLECGEKRKKDLSDLRVWVMSKLIQVQMNYA